MELSKPQARFTEQGIRNKISRWLSDPFVREVIHYRIGATTRTVAAAVSSWTIRRLQQLWTHRLGRTVLLTNRMDWTAEQVVAGYSGQQQIEQVFRGLKDGDWLGWGPMYHWTDSKIRDPCFLLHARHLAAAVPSSHRRRVAWPGLTVEQLLEELRQIQQFVLLYPPQGDKGPNRVATVLSKQTLAQQALAESLGLDQLCSTQRG